MKYAFMEGNSLKKTSILLILIGLGAISVSLFLTPTFTTNYISPDKNISTVGLAQLQIYRGLLASLGVFLSAIGITIVIIHPKKVKDIYNWLIRMFPVLIVLATILICLIKIQSLLSWRFTSDIFSYDTYLREIVTNKKLVEFVYGNLLGDHAYLNLFLLIPLKLILKSNFIYFLLIINPLLFLGSAVSVFNVLKNKLNPTLTFLGASSYLIGFGIAYKGLSERIYGYHPDLGSGFLLIIITCILIQQAETRNISSTVWIFILGILYLSLKEEMAILGLIFFLILYIGTKQKRFFWLTVISLVFIGLDFYIINYFQTSFNRTNTNVLSILSSNIQTHGLRSLITNPRGRQVNVLGYWGFIILSSIIFHWRWYKIRKLNPYLLGLYYAGLIKIGTSLFLLDFDLTSWHNLPGAFMIGTSILLDITTNNRGKDQVKITFMIRILLISLILFFAFESLFLFRQVNENFRRAPKASVYTKEIKLLSQDIPKERIVSIPMNAAMSLIDNRFTFYPSGISIGPIGIADYAIIPVNNSHLYADPYDRYKLYPIDDYLDSFHLLSKTEYFQLYQRYALDEISKEIRYQFFSELNLLQLIPLPK